MFVKSAPIPAGTDMAHPSEILAALTADPEVNAAQVVATAGGTKLRSAYRILAGQAPKLVTFRRLVSRASRLPLAVKRGLVDWLLDGSGFVAVEAEGPGVAELDANGNGRPDTGDVVIHFSRAACEAAAGVRTLIEQERFTEAESLARSVARHAECVIATLAKVNAKGPRAAG